MGIDTPLELLIEIVDIQAELADIEARLAKNWDRPLGAAARSLLAGAATTDAMPSPLRSASLSQRRSFFAPVADRAASARRAISTTAIGFGGLSLSSRSPSLLVGLQTPVIAAASERAAPTGASTQPLAPTAPGAALTAPIPPYRADLAVAGPTSMRAGSSATLALTITVAANAEPQPNIPLAAGSGYTATAQIQPGNFEVGAIVAGLRDAQPLALQSPARWAWVIAPKDQRLGDQALVVDLFISDQTHTRVDTPFASIGINVTDLLGLPPPIGYIIGGIASVLGAVLSAIGVGAWIRARLLKTPDAAPTTSPQPVTNPVAVASLLSAPAAPSPIMPILNAELPAPNPVASAPPARPARRRKAKDAADDQ